eukprot:270076_1
MMLAAKTLDLYDECKQNKDRTVEILHSHIEVISESEDKRSIGNYVDDLINNKDLIRNKGAIVGDKYELWWALFCIIQNGYFVEETTLKQKTKEQYQIINRLANLFFRHHTTLFKRKKHARDFLKRNIKNGRVKRFQKHIKKTKKFKYNPFNDSRYDVSIGLNDNIDQIIEAEISNDFNVNDCACLSNKHQKQMKQIKTDYLKQQIQIIKNEFKVVFKEVKCTNVYVSNKLALFVLNVSEKSGFNCIDKIQSEGIFFYEQMKDLMSQKEKEQKLKAINTNNLHDRNNKRKRDKTQIDNIGQCPHRKKRKVYQHKHDTISELNNFLDVMTGSPIKQPAISPSGHVLGYESWTKILRMSSCKNLCPFTKQPLTRRSLIKLTNDNYQNYKNKIADLTATDVAMAMIVNNVKL